MSDLVERLKIVDLAQALVDKMNAVTQSDEYMAVWGLAFEHNIGQAVPNWGKEFEALQSALKQLKGA